MVVNETAAATSPPSSSSSLRTCVKNANEEIFILFFQFAIFSIGDRIVEDNLSATLERHTFSVLLYLPNDLTSNCQNEKFDWFLRDDNDHFNKRLQNMNLPPI